MIGALDVADMPACQHWPISEEVRQSVADLASLASDEVAQSRRATDLIWRWQEGRCAVCGWGGREVEPGRWDRDDFVVDHDHATALVRGWLCQSCNRVEPHADGEFSRYRDWPPAVRLGIAVRYEHPWRGLVEPQPWLDPRNFDPARSAAYRLQGRYRRHLPAEGIDHG